MILATAIVSGSNDIVVFVCIDVSAIATVISAVISNALNPKLAAVVDVVDVVDVICVVVVPPLEVVVVPSLAAVVVVVVATVVVTGGIGVSIVIDISTLKLTVERFCRDLFFRVGMVQETVTSVIVPPPLTLSFVAMLVTNISSHCVVVVSSGRPTFTCAAAIVSTTACIHALDWAHIHPPGRRTDT